MATTMQDTRIVTDTKRESEYSMGTPRLFHVCKATYVKRQTITVILFGITDDCTSSNTNTAQKQHKNY